MVVFFIWLSTPQLVKSLNLLYVWHEDTPFGRRIPVVYSLSCGEPPRMQY